MPFHLVSKWPEWSHNPPKREARKCCPLKSPSLVWTADPRGHGRGNGCLDRTLTARDKPVFSMSQIAQQCLGLPPCLRLWGLSPGLVVAPWASTLLSSSVSEAKTVFTEGSADFLGNFPESRWTTAFPDAGCSTEFAILVFAYRVQEIKINSVIRGHEGETGAPPTVDLTWPLPTSLPSLRAVTSGL